MPVDNQERQFVKSLTALADSVAASRSPVHVETYMSKAASLLYIDPSANLAACLDAEKALAELLS